MPKGLLIPADNSAEIKEITLNSYDEYREAIGGGWLQAIPFPGRDDVTPYFDEEGKIKGLARNDRATEILKAVMFEDDFISGDCLLMGFEIETGEDLDLPEDVMAEVKGA